MFSAQVCGRHGSLKELILLVLVLSGLPLFSGYNVWVNGELGVTDILRIIGLHGGPLLRRMIGSGRLLGRLRYNALFKVMPRSRTLW